MYLLVGDPHLKNNNLDIAEELFALVESKGLTTIWLGDMLDTKELIRGKCMNALISYFKRSRLQHFVLVGNHDWFNLDCQAHSLESLKLLQNVVVVDAPTRLDEMTLVPYIHDQNKLREILGRAHAGTVLIGHLDVAGHDYGNGHLSKNGLKLEELSKFRAVISGHFHKFQQSSNLTYLGTPFTHSFGEANQHKYLATFDAERCALEFEETPFRKHLSIEIDCNQSDQRDWEAANNATLWRVILTGSQENINAFDRSRLAHLDVKWVTRPSDFQTNDVQIDETVSNEVQFQKWAKDVRGLDEATITLGSQILESVK
jgi:DNA repair exonuclease SbcCD nuclease subunit